MAQPNLCQYHAMSSLHSRPRARVVLDLHFTTRGDKGFGSTKIRAMPTTHTISHTATLPTSNNTEHNAKDGRTDPILNMSHHIWISEDPFDNLMSFNMKVTGDHPTLGMLFTQCLTCNCPQLVDIQKGTPAACTPWQRSSIKHSIIKLVNGYNISSVNDIESAIQQAWSGKLIQITVVFATDKYYRIHPTDSNPILYWDQLNVISKINHDIN